MKHLKIYKFPFKNVIVLAIECKMYLKIHFGENGYPSLRFPNMVKVNIHEH